MSDRTLPPVQFTTGNAPLPDVGTLSYNGVTFSSLFHSTVSWEPEQDSATRTVKWIKGTIEVEGVVTLGPLQKTIDTQMGTLRQLLEQDAGTLTYSGRGFDDLIVNPGAGAAAGVRDLNWGPKPETLFFQPLGGGLSAMVRWKVTTWISELNAGGANVLQFCEDTTVTFDEEQYSGIAIRGVMEIGLTRNSVNDRTVSTTVDALRQQWLTQVGASIDLTRFRVTRRSFNVSRDKRVMDWEFAAEELPPTVMPFGAPAAHGSFRFQPQEKGVGFIRWLCSLRCTYTIDKRYPRRTAWFHFVLLLWHRMLFSRLFGVPGIGNNAAAPQNPPFAAILQRLLTELPVPDIKPENATARMQAILQTVRNANGVFGQNTNALLISMSGEEGLYLDSKSVTFEAQWKLFTPLADILMATGFWRYIGLQASQSNYRGTNNAWATSMQDISGWKSWLTNSLDPAGEVIVDFGSEGPL